MSRCPSVDRLVVLHDEGAFGVRAQRIWWHVRRCPHCLAVLQTLSEIAATIHAVDAATSDAEAVGPTYADLRVRLHARRAVASLPAEAVLWRWRATVAVATGMLVLALMRPPVTVHAEALLTRVEAAEDAAQADFQWIEVRIAPVGFGAQRPAMVVSMDGREPVHRAALVAAVRPEWRGAVRQFLAESPLDDGRPLLRSAAFRTWRRSISGARDEVVSDLVRPTTLRTSNATGTAFAELRVLPAGARIVQLTYVARGLRLDVRERSYHPAPRRASETLSVTAIDPAALDASELQVRRVLHETGADLGGLVRITRDADRVSVAGRSPAAARLIERLGTLPHTRLDVRPGPAADVRRVVPGLSAWRTRVLRGTDEMFVSTFVERAGIIADRVAALRELAERYPTSETSRMPRHSRQEVERLAGVHYRDLLGALKEIRPAVSLLVGLPAEQRAFPPDGPLPAPDWRSRAHAAHVAAERFQNDVRGLVKQDDLPLPTGMHPMSRSYGRLCETLVQP